MYDLKSRKARTLLLLPAFIMPLLSNVLFRFNESDFWVSFPYGFTYGWLGALAVMYIPIELEERRRLQKRRQDALKEIHQIIGEHHKKRYGVKL